MKRKLKALIRGIDQSKYMRPIYNLILDKTGKIKTTALVALLELHKIDLSVSDLAKIT